MSNLNLSDSDIKNIADNVFERLLPYLDWRFELVNKQLFEISQSRPLPSPAASSSAASGHCKACGEAIIFMITAKGKAIPCDPGPGVEKNGDYVHGKHRSHLDTCANKVS